MNKLLLTGAALLALTVSNTANADEYSMNNDRLTGPYVGVYGGYGWTDADASGAVSAFDGDINGADYGIFTGMKVDTLLDQTVNRLGLSLTGAVEIQYGWSSQDDTINGVNFEKENEFGISFRPGLAFVDQINPLDFNTYGIFGYKRAEYEVAVAGVSGDEDYDGFELGLGTELVAYDNMGVRLEYSHTWYEEKDGFDPSEDSLRLGLSYQF